MYPKTAFVHCAAHRLNLVVNDLNSVEEIRNTVGTIKSTIKFFRESAKRRGLVPNVPLLCETRWTAMYKSIRVFTGHFKDIYKQLGVLASASSEKTSQDAHQLQCASGTSTFLFCLFIVAKYSAILELVTQALQAVELDVFKVQDHIQKLLSTSGTHRKEADVRLKGDIMKEV